jgi:hypothetical protein
LATLVRIDAAVPLVALTCYGIVSSPSFRMRHLCFGLGAVFIFVGGQTIARLVYYGLPFPNTYYLKMTGFPPVQRIARGAFVTGRSLWHPFWPALVAAAIALWVRRKNISLKPEHFPTWIQHPAAPIGAVAFMQIAYSIYVGGDAWETEIFMNRYLVVVAPLLFVLMVATIIHVGQIVSNVVLSHASWSRKGDLIPTVVPSLVLAMILVIWVNTPANYESCAKQALFQEDQQIVLPAQIHANLSSVLNTVMEPDATMAIDWAGSLPYYLDRHFFDILGKSDSVIAHEPMRHNSSGSNVWYKEFYPGHMKWDADYTMNKLKPDVVLEVWSGPLGSFLPFLNAKFIGYQMGVGPKIYFLKNSPRIHWDNIPKSWTTGK